VNDYPRNDHLRRRRYALEVAHADRYVGELLSELERLGLYRQSVVVFTSDHGEGLGQHGGFGHVENLSDALIRVPLIVKLPEGDARRAALASATERIASHVDVVPTLLELAGLPPLPGQRGISLLEPHDTIHIAQTSRPEAKENQLAFRDERFKMVYFPDDERFELYDVVVDPGELRDVFAERGHERADWPERLRSLYASARRGETGEAGEASDPEERDRMLRALGYAGDGE
jgi:arylsulfatase A-like enzyme